MTRKNSVGYNTIAKVSEPRLVLSSMARPFSLVGGYFPRKLPQEQGEVLGAGLNRSESRVAPSCRWADGEGAMEARLFVGG